MEHEIFIIDNKCEAIAEAKEIFKNEKEYHFKNYKTKNLETALKNIPELIIINEDNIDIPIIEMCNQIRQDDDNSITPIIVVSSNMEKEHRLKVFDCAVEYYIKAPMDKEYLYYTIKNIIRLININRRVSPLTGLPGNVQIHAELKKRLSNREDFAILYIDLDNFKAYNDVYGFLKGDEIIKFTAKIILKHVHKDCEDTGFVGHIGGDDFVAIIRPDECEAVCQDIIAEFDKKVKEYFTDEDIEKGYLEVANRKNVMEEFPLTSISVGVVIADGGRFHNILEIGEVGAQVKHVAKTIMGSSYAIDRRKYE